MPTTEVHRKLSSSGLEMPDIEEVREISKDDVSSVRAENLRDFRGDDVDSNFGYGECGRQTQHLRVPSDQEIPPNARYDNIKCDRSATKVEATTPNASDSFDTTTLRKSIGEISRSNSLKAEPEKRNTLKGVPDERSTSILERSPGKPQLEEALELRSRDLEPAIPREGTEKRKELRSLKVYRLLSTQSEDKVDEEEEEVNSSCFADRRISLEIRRKDADDDDDEEEDEDEKIKNSLHCANRFGESADIRIDYAEKRENSRTNSRAIRKFSSPGEVGESLKLLGEAVGVSARPIYPYCPYSPYGSPQGSPRNRRRPLRESRRVSIDNRQGALQLNQYKLLDNIGQGSYGIVKLAYNEEDETHYAMKILSKKKLMKKAGIFGRMAPGRRGSADPLAKVYREIALLKKLDHPNVVKLLEVLDDPDEDNLYLVFELVQKGEILQIPTDKPLDEETARRNFKDVVMGVEYLHYQRIVHRDIKPSNLLVDSEGRIKIADLGVSAELRASGELLSGPAGTPAFAAPETTTPGAHYSGTLCDVWSMGVTLYSLVTGKVPWDGAGSIIAVQAAVRAEPLKFPETPILSDELRDLITRMLSKDPKERINLRGMKEHVWLTNHGRDPLPSEGDNCRLPVTVTDEEVERVVTKVPKLDTLILIKKMLKQHSFQNPFLSRKMGRALGNDAEVGTETSTLGSTLVRTTDSLSQRGATKRNAKSDRFQKAGRSNSAPDSFDWQASTRQISTESPLPPVTEASIQETEVEKR